MNIKNIVAPFVITIALLVANPVTASEESRAQKELEPSTLMYHKAVRWNDFHEAAALLDPTAPQNIPLPEDIDERYKSVQVVAYRVKSASSPGPFLYQQRVEIGVVNADTQIMKNVIDNQVWRYDSAAKRWWLTTGLPKLD